MLGPMKTLPSLAFALGVALLVGPHSSRAAGEGAPQLNFPLACKVGVSCEVQNYVDRDAGPGAADYRCSTETYDKHNGVDIRLLDMAAQRAGVDVLAAAPGPVASGFAARAGMRLGRAMRPEDIAREIVDALGRRTTVRPGGLSKLLGWSLATLPRALRVQVLARVMAGMTAHHAGAASA